MPTNDFELVKWTLRMLYLQKFKLGKSFDVSTIYCGMARKRFLLKLLLDNRLNNLVAYAIQINVPGKEINLGKN